MEKEKVMRYGCVIEKTKTGFSAYVPDLPGCSATGKTKAQIRRRIQEAVAIHLHSMIEEGDRIPKPTTEFEYMDIQVGS